MEKWEPSDSSRRGGGDLLEGFRGFWLGDFPRPSFGGSSGCEDSRRPGPQPRRSLIYPWRFTILAKARLAMEGHIDINVKHSPSPRRREHQ
jgi:hypothetical protein